MTESHSTTSTGDAKGPTLATVNGGKPAHPLSSATPEQKSSGPGAQTMVPAKAYPQNTAAVAEINQVETARESAPAGHPKEAAVAPPLEIKPAEKAAAKETPAPTTEELQRMISEAAYYLAEKRHFEPGFEHEDWEDAKAAVLARLSENR